MPKEFDFAEGESSPEKRPSIFFTSVMDRANHTKRKKGTSGEEENEEITPDADTQGSESDESMDSEDEIVDLSSTICKTTFKDPGNLEWLWNSKRDMNCYKVSEF